MRHSLVVNFDNQAARAAFKTRLEHVRSLISPAGQPSLDNNGLMSAIFDLVENCVRPSFPGSTRAQAGMQSFNKAKGRLVARYI